MSDIPDQDYYLGKREKEVEWNSKMAVNPKEESQKKQEVEIG